MFPRNIWTQKQKISSKFVAIVSIEKLMVSELNIVKVDLKSSPDDENYTIYKKFL